MDNKTLTERARSWASDNMGTPSRMLRDLATALEQSDRERDQLQGELTASRATCNEAMEAMAEFAISSGPAAAASRVQLSMARQERNAATQQLTACRTELAIRDEQLVRVSGERLALADWAKVAGPILSMVSELHESPEAHEYHGMVFRMLMKAELPGKVPQ